MKTEDMQDLSGDYDIHIPFKTKDGKRYRLVPIDQPDINTPSESNGISDDAGVFFIGEPESKETKQLYHLNCDKCGEPYWSQEGFPTPQLCFKCSNPESKKSAEEIKEKYHAIQQFVCEGYQHIQILLAMEEYASQFGQFEQKEKKPDWLPMDDRVIGIDIIKRDAEINHQQTLKNIDEHFKKMKGYSNEVNPIAYEWHNLTTGHCYVDYIPHPAQDEKDGYIKKPLYEQSPDPPQTVIMPSDNKWNDFIEMFEAFYHEPFGTDNLAEVKAFLESQVKVIDLREELIKFKKFWNDKKYISSHMDLKDINEYLTQK